MANLKSRSNSFPSKSHPSAQDVQEKLCRLKSSAEASPSSSSTLANLAQLQDLYEGINNLIRIPSLQSSKQGEIWINELLEGSLGLVDLCAFSREVVCLMKESVQRLESSIRRSRGEDISAYVASRKKIEKMMNKYIKNLKNFNKNKNYDLSVNPIMMILREAEVLGFSVLKSSLLMLSGVKERSNQKGWWFLSKFAQTRWGGCSDSDEDIGDDDLCSVKVPKLRKNAAMKEMLKQLNSTEMVMQEVEEGLELLYRSLVKTRVSLLNVVSQ